VAENKALSAEVDQLRSEAREKTAEMSAQEESLLDLNRRLADQDRQRRGQSYILSSYMWPRSQFLLTRDCSCRLGGGGCAPPAREGAARPGACQSAGDWAPSWRS